MRTTTRAKRRANFHDEALMQTLDAGAHSEGNTIHTILAEQYDPSQTHRYHQETFEYPFASPNTHDAP